MREKPASGEEGMRTAFSPCAAAALHREARVLTATCHPAIVPVLDVMNGRAIAVGWIFLTAGVATATGFLVLLLSPLCGAAYGAALVSGLRETERLAKLLFGERFAPAL